MGWRVREPTLGLDEGSSNSERVESSAPVPLISVMADPGPTGLGRALVLVAHGLDSTLAELDFRAKITQGSSFLATLGFGAGRPFRVATERNPKATGKGS